MSAIVAGGACGLLVSSVFVSIGAIMLLLIVKDAPPGLQPLFEKVPPAKIAIAGTVLAYPVWGIIGVVMGILYRISTEQAPGSGIGSPNLVFTVAVVVASAALAAPLAILLRRVLSGFVAIVFAVVGIFGWFLPYFAG